MKKALLFAAIVAVLGAWAASIRLFDNDLSAGPRVAYSSVGDPNPWFLAFSAELEKEAEKRGYQFRVTHAQAKLEKQIADVEDIVAQKPDFLILGPIDRDGSADALRIAKKAGVPVVVVNRDINGVAGQDYITKIYSDFEWIGEKMAELVHDAFAPDAKEIRVVELHGTPLKTSWVFIRRKRVVQPNIESWLYRHLSIPPSRHKRRIFILGSDNSCARKKCWLANRLFCNFSRSSAKIKERKHPSRCLRL